MEHEDDQGFETEPRRRIKPARVADRPHWVTIVLAFLGPAVTIIAVLVAVSSLKTSQKAIAASELATRMSQRAYVSVKSGVFRVHGLDVSWPLPKSTESSRPVYAVGMLHTEFQLANDGNTPADLLRLEFVVDVPERWEVLSIQSPKHPSGRTITEIHEGLGVIGPRVNATRKYEWQLTVPLELTNAVLFERTMERASGRVVPGISLIRLRAKLLVRDIFGDTSTVAWCWYPSWDRHWPLGC